MNTQEYLREFEQCTTKMLAITTAKNKDYSGSDSDPFRNFKAVEQLGICTVEQGFLTRMMDKVMRVNNIIKSGNAAVKDESVEDTLLDLANYSLLLRCYLVGKARESSTTKMVVSGQIKDVPWEYTKNTLGSQIDVK